MQVSTGKTEASWSPFGAQAQAFARWLDRLFTGAAKSADERAWFWLGALAMIYLVCTVARSVAKPLWFDELFTFYISRVPGWKERLSLALTDGGPPLFYGLTHASLRLFGENSLASRMPEIMGFWLMCVCLFLFVRRRCAAIYAFLAVLLAVGSNAYAYAYEARPYGIILGMAGLSLWCWQCIAEDRRRILALVFLAISVAVAMNIHYYGAQIAVPLLAGEACRTLERRKIDGEVLSAVALGLSPLIYLIPLAHRGFLATYGSAWNPALFVAKPHAASFVSFYDHLVEPMLFYVLAGMLATALVYLLGGQEPPLAESSSAKFPLHELAASLGYLLVPGMMLIATRLETGNWAERYALTAVVGCVILFVYFCTVLSRGRFVLPCLLIAPLFCMWVVQTPRSGAQVPTQWSNFRMSSLMYPKGEAFPIVVTDCGWFLQMAHYSAPEVASRLVYLTDLAHAVRKPDYVGQMSLFHCRGILPGDVEDYRVFLRHNREFWLLHHCVPLIEWLPSQLRGEGWKLEYQAQYHDGILFRVRDEDKALPSR